MPRKVVVTLNLLDESESESKEQVEKEIFEELSKSLPLIPWMKDVEKVEVIEI